MSGDLGAAVASAPAVRRSMSEPVSVLAPGRAAPSSIPAEIRRNTVSFNGCTANIVRDDLGAVLGLVGAAHCVRTTSNSMCDGVLFASGTNWPIERSAITIDDTTDVFYSGLLGHHATDVWRQVRTNSAGADIGNLPTTTALAMAGYPSHHNPRGELVLLSLSLGGIVHWPNDLADTIATFGDWNALEQTCSPGASGSGLYLYIEGRGWVIIAVLASRAEFVGVQTMPYGAEYGLELRSFFEQQLGMTIDADYMCGFAPPSPPPGSSSSTFTSVVRTVFSPETALHAETTN